MLRSTSPFDSEYTYDYTSSKPNSRPSSTASPLHFLYPVMHTSTTSQHASSSSIHSPREASSSSHRESHHHRHTHTLSSSHHTPKRDSKAADISRLLDPAYAGSRPHAHDRAVYVDTQGQLHDPDFRHFPTADKFTRSASPTSPRRQQRRAVSPRRPHWELAETENALTDEEEDELLAIELGLDDPSATSSAFFLSHPRYHSATATRRASMNSTTGAKRYGRPREGAYAHSSYTHGYSQTYTTATSPAATASTSTTTSPASNPTWYSPTGTTSTLPTSYESDNTVLSSSGDWDGEKGCPIKKRRRLSKGDSKEERMRKEEEKERDREFRRSIEATRPVWVEENVQHQEKEKNEGAEDDDNLRLNTANGEYVPTCTQGLKRQWQAISLRFRFGVFRAQRRMMRRVNSLL